MVPSVEGISESQLRVLHEFVQLGCTQHSQKVVNFLCSETVA